MWLQFHQTACPERCVVETFEHCSVVVAHRVKSSLPCQLTSSLLLLSWKEELLLLQRQLDEREAELGRLRDGGRLRAGGADGGRRRRRLAFLPLHDL